MAYHLSEVTLKIAMRHLCRYGDTDIFPHLPELAFFADEEKTVAAELTKLDLDSYTPAGAIVALAPKGRHSFRIAHQLSALDTLLLLACVIEIGDKIEARRQSSTGARAFSYRFGLDSKSDQIFRTDRTYKDWLHKQMSLIDKHKNIRNIVVTDISDYYLRINFHRLENLLDEVAPSHGAARFIKKHVKIIRAKQSFGLPVGGSAARLLAELALVDTDEALKDKEFAATRFVDDFRIFLTSTQDPYDALGYLAEQLGINEGLSLNAAKTEVLARRDYVRRMERLTTDLDEEVEGVALDTLTAELYFDEEPDEKDLERLKGLNLVELLESEIDADEWDVGRIKVLFRALKIARPEKSVELIKDRFDDLLVFSKEACLLMEALNEEYPGCFGEIIDRLIEAILSPPASSVQLIRTWLLEILVRGVINITYAQLKKMEPLAATLDKKQLLLLRGRLADKNYFRKQKTAIHNFSAVELPSLVWGASCLPKDEYEKWLDTLKVTFDKPLGGLFLKWAAHNKSKLISKLSVTVVDHPE